VQPQTGRTHFLCLPRMNGALYSQALQDFAGAVGAGPHRRIVLVVGGAGPHRSGAVVVPEGLHLVTLPPYSPELQPAERLWPLTNEPLVNRHGAGASVPDAGGDDRGRAWSDAVPRVASDRQITAECDTVTVPTELVLGPVFPSDV
jgi:hypothetical protein